MERDKQYSSRRIPQSTPNKKIGNIQYLPKPKLSRPSFSNDIIVVDNDIPVVNNDIYITNS